MIFLNFSRNFSCKNNNFDFSFVIFFSLKGTSAYAGPHYHKLYGRVIHVWDNRRGQPNLSAMKQPRSGRSSSVIKFASPSGKYAFSFDFFGYIIISYLLNCQLELQKIIDISHLQTRIKKVFKTGNFYSYKKYVVYNIILKYTNFPKILHLMFLHFLIYFLIFLHFLVYFHNCG